MFKCTTFYCQILYLTAKKYLTANVTFHICLKRWRITLKKARRSRARQGGSGVKKRPESGEMSIICRRRGASISLYCTMPRASATTPLTAAYLSTHNHYLCMHSAYSRLLFLLFTTVCVFLILRFWYPDYDISNEVKRVVRF